MEKALHKDSVTNQTEGETSADSYQKLAEAVRDSQIRRGYHHEDDGKILAEYGQSQGEVVLIDNLGAFATWNEDMKGSRSWTG